MHFQLLLILCAASPVTSGPALHGPVNHRLALRNQAVTTDQSSVLPDPQFGGPASVGVAPMMAPRFNGDGVVPGSLAVPDASAGNSFAEPVSGESLGEAGGGQPPCHGSGLGHCLGWLWPGTHCDPVTHTRYRALWNLNPGDMVPWAPYFPEYHGDYYFRPYHWTQVFEQQRIASRWGADPRMPYTSNVFQAVYAELGIPEAPGLEQLPPPNGAKKKPSDYFESVNCGYSR